jgi:hypothetical protein
MNLIYLAMLTERIPILPVFNPSHISGGSSDTEVVDTTFGEVFDVPRLAKELRMPILEWWQVKDRKSTTVDSLGCWNVWQAVMEHSSGPQYSPTPRKLNIGELTVLCRVRPLIVPARYFMDDCSEVGQAQA